jgi:hypothetical protein
MHADVDRALAVNIDLLCGMVAAVGADKPVGHAVATSRPMVKLSGWSMVCWVPLVTSILSRVISVADSPCQSSHSTEFAICAGYTGRQWR